LTAQISDIWCQDMYQQVERGLQGSKPPGVFVDEAGSLSCSPLSDPNLPPRWLVPASLRDRVCILNHFAKVAGHPGTTRTTKNISRYWYWPTLAKDCVAIVRNCPSCVAKRLKNGTKRTVPITIFPPDRPLEFLAIDVLGPLPITRRRNRFVLCITDRFSKTSVAVAMLDQTASTVA
jgi:hypothetical protein